MTTTTLICLLVVGFFLEVGAAYFLWRRDQDLRVTEEIPRTEILDTNTALADKVAKCDAELSNQALRHEAEKQGLKTIWKTRIHQTEVTKHAEGAERAIAAFFASLDLPQPNMISTPTLRERPLPDLRTVEADHRQLALRDYLDDMSWARIVYLRNFLKSNPFEIYSEERQLREFEEELPAEDQPSVTLPPMEMPSTPGDRRALGQIAELDKRRLAGEDV